MPEQAFAATLIRPRPSDSSWIVLDAVVRFGLRALISFRRGSRPVLASKPRIASAARVAVTVALVDVTSVMQRLYPLGRRDRSPLGVGRIRRDTRLSELCPLGGSILMPMVALTLSIPPEKLTPWKQAMAEMAGPRRAAFAASKRRQGVRRQNVFLQQGPDGPREILIIEADDPGRALEMIGTSQEPFDVWLREMVQDTYKLDLSQPMGPPPEQLLAWSADEV
jgi:hypothetical protein